MAVTKALSLSYFVLYYFQNLRSAEGERFTGDFDNTAGSSYKPGRPPSCITKLPINLSELIPPCQLTSFVYFDSAYLSHNVELRLHFCTARAFVLNH